MPRRKVLAVIVLYDDGVGVQAEISRPEGGTIYDSAAYANVKAPVPDIQREAVRRVLAGAVERIRLDDDYGR